MARRGIAASDRSYIGVIGQSLAGGAQIASLAAGALVTAACAVLIILKARSSLRDAGVKA